MARQLEIIAFVACRICYSVFNNREEGLKAAAVGMKLLYMKIMAYHDHNIFLYAFRQYCSSLHVIQITVLHYFTSYQA